MQQTSTRAGKYVDQPTGYRAFVPNPLPPEPKIQYDEDLITLLSNADRALGRLDGSTDALPNPDLFVMMYVRKEAVLSSQIEGTQASLNDILEVESHLHATNVHADVGDIVNYVYAMNYGMERLRTLPISLRLVCEIHEKLMRNTRGSELHPGEFRRSQNWIGPQGCNLTNARFVPPNPEDMKSALENWELYLHDETPSPLLVKIGIAHAQFETIHPFLDGNGRVGRLLITFLLCQQNILKRPLLYLSYYFKQNRLEYYDRLQAIREKGDWEGWLKFFLRGVASVSNEASVTAKAIIELRERQRAIIQEQFGRVTSSGLALHESLFEKPYVNTILAKEITSLEFPAANRLLANMLSAGILREITGKGRNRVYSHWQYLNLFTDQEMEARDVLSTPTEN
jgi:Fic family protein